MTGPPHIDPDRLDFSQFHPLDHNIIQCKGYPTGRYAHAMMRWEYQVYPLIRTRTFCVLGFHRWATGWKKGGNAEFREFRLCLDCYRTPKAHEE